MFKKFTAMLILGVAVATSLTSCDKDVAQEPQTASEIPTLVDGRLKFTTLTSFQTYLKANEKKSVEELMQANRDMKFVSHLRFTSEAGIEPSKQIYPSSLHSSSKNAARNAMVRGGELLGDEPLDGPPINVIETTIPDPLFAFVLDENREAVIGKLVYRAGNDYCFWYPKGRQDLVDNFYQQVDSGEISIEDTELHGYGDLMVKRVELVTNSPTGATANAGSTPFFDNIRRKRDKNWDDTHRIECEIWQGNWLIYASSGIKTFSTQYTRKWVFFKGWLDLKADRVTAVATVKYNQPVPGGPTQVATAEALEISETNAAVAVRRFDWATAQIGYTSTGVIPQKLLVYINLAQNLVTVPNLNVGPTQPATLTVYFNSLQSLHTGTWNGVTIQQTVNW